MPARFHPVSPSIFDRRFAKLSGDAQRVLFHVLCCGGRTSEGLFQYRVPYAAADLGTDTFKVEVALGELEDAGYIKFDADSETLLDCHALRLNPLKNGVGKKGTEKEGQVVPDLRIPSAIKHLEHLLDEPLAREFLKVANRYSPDLVTALVERFPERLNALLQQAPSKPLDSPFEAPSREEEESLRRREEERRVEEVRDEDSPDTCEGCHFGGATVQLSDGSRLCEGCAKQNEIQVVAL